MCPKDMLPTLEVIRLIIKVYIWIGLVAQACYPLY